MKQKIMNAKLPSSLFFCKMPFLILGVFVPDEVGCRTVLEQKHTETGYRNLRRTFVFMQFIPPTGITGRETDGGGLESAAPAEERNHTKTNQSSSELNWWALTPVYESSSEHLDSIKQKEVMTHLHPSAGCFPESCRTKTNSNVWIHQLQFKKQLSEKKTEKQTNKLFVCTTEC